MAETADPQETAFRILRRASFGAGHPYSIPRSGLSDAGSIDGFTAADLQAFQAKWLAPGNATIIVVGDLTLAEAGALVERRMAGWRGDEGPRPSPVIPTVALPARSRLIVVDRPGAPQSLILGGTLVPGTGGPRDAAIETVNRILGGGFGSRINMNLRERKRWSYGSGSGMADARGQRSFQINAAVQTDKTADALAELVRELRDITGPVAITRQERDAAITSSIAELPVGYESQSAVSNAIASARTFGRELDWPNRIGGQYAALTLDDLRSTAQDLIDPDRMIWIVIGDRSRIETPLKALDLAPIEWFANDGRPLD